MAKKKEEELSDAAKAAIEKLEKKEKAARAAAVAEKKRFDEAAKVFGAPEWVEKIVIPLGDRGALLWRHLKATWKRQPKGERILEAEWEKFSKDLKDK